MRRGVRLGGALKLNHLRAAAHSRVAEARSRCEPLLRATFAAVGVAYPPAALHLRGFKLERCLELWAQAAGDPRLPFVLVTAFPILGLSGTPGPKRREGDLQVPEGFYRVDRFNPRSRFYLSLGLDYPNASDRRLAPDPARPGSDIFIHGGERSRGCLAIGDEAMAFLYLAALDTSGSGRRAITVHLLPCRMDTPDWVGLLAPWHTANPGLYPFWQNLAESCRQFEQHRQPPRIQIDAAARRQFPPVTGSLKSL